MQRLRRGRHSIGKGLIVGGITAAAIGPASRQTTVSLDESKRITEDLGISVGASRRRTSFGGVQPVARARTIWSWASSTRSTRIRRRRHWCLRGSAGRLAAPAAHRINHASGRGVGMQAQLHFFLDDLFPKSLGKPLFGGRS